MTYSAADALKDFEAGTPISEIEDKLPKSMFQVPEQVCKSVLALYDNNGFFKDNLDLLSLFNKKGKIHLRYLYDFGERLGGILPNERLKEIKTNKPIKEPFIRELIQKGYVKCLETLLEQCNVETKDNLKNIILKNSSESSKKDQIQALCLSQKEMITATEINTFPTEILSSAILKKVKEQERVNVLKLALSKKNIELIKLLAEEKTLFTTDDILRLLDDGETAFANELIDLQLVDIDCIRDELIARGILQLPRAESKSKSNSGVEDIEGIFKAPLQAQEYINKFSQIAPKTLNSWIESILDSKDFSRAYHLELAILVLNSAYITKPLMQKIHEFMTQAKLATNNNSFTTIDHFINYFERTGLTKHLNLAKCYNHLSSQKIELPSMVHPDKEAKYLTSLSYVTRRPINRASNSWNFLQSMHYPDPEFIWEFLTIEGREELIKYSKEYIERFESKANDLFEKFKIFSIVNLKEYCDVTKEVSPQIFYPPYKRSFYNSNLICFHDTIIEQLKKKYPDERIDQLEASKYWKKKSESDRIELLNYDIRVPSTWEGVIACEYFELLPLNFKDAIYEHIKSCCTKMNEVFLENNADHSHPDFIWYYLTPEGRVFLLTSLQQQINQRPTDFIDTHYRMFKPSEQPKIEIPPVRTVGKTYYDFIQECRKNKLDSSDVMSDIEDSDGMDDLMTLAQADSFFDKLTEPNNEKFLQDMVYDKKQCNHPVFNRRPLRSLVECLFNFYAGIEQQKVEILCELFLSNEELKEAFIQNNHRDLVDNLMQIFRENCPNLISSFGCR